MLDKSARDGIIREIAKLHSATVVGIDHFKHRTYPQEHLIWNTYHAYEHIGNYNQVMENPPWKFDLLFATLLNSGNRNRHNVQGLVSSLVSFPEFNLEIILLFMNENFISNF